MLIYVKAVMTTMSKQGIKLFWHLFLFKNAKELRAM
jgi:hypothetical protein